jgi:trans-aconitate methyltransferase
VFDRSAHVYDLLYGGMKSYAAEADELASLIVDRRADAASLLDVACGTGEHLRLLADRFDDLAGVDLDDGMLAVARGKLPDARLETGDMRTFDLGRAFDAVTCLFSSVGYLASTEELDAAIGRMAAHLAPGGVLIVDGWIRPDAWRPGVNVHALAAADDDVAAARVARTWRDGDRTTLEFRYLVANAEGFDTIEERHVMTLFAADDYRAAFARAGLEPEVVAGPMGPHRDRYVAVAG